MHRALLSTAATFAAVLAVAGQTAARPDVASGNAADASLAVWDGARWQSWWHAKSAPTRWHRADPRVTRAVHWRAAQPGLDVGTVRFAGRGEAWRFNVTLLRIDPARHTVALHVVRAPDGRALPWTVDALPADASFGVNAGMFDAVGPWGWIVLDGTERQGPGRGPLSSAFIVDRAGRPRIVPADSIAPLRATGVRWAVQSYPTALSDGGTVPVPLRGPERGIDVEHRDARVGLGIMRDGRVLLALTRFDGLRGRLGVIPLGPTLQEMTAILGALGARDAVFLDGGISAQLAVRDSTGAVRRWSGLRSVPLALIGRPRSSEW